MERMQQHAASSERMTLERLPEYTSLAVTVENDFSDVLAAVNERLNAHLEPRESGAHITFITPVEREVLGELTTEELEDMEHIIEDLKQGIGVTVTGIGCIDGNRRTDLRVADTEKRVAYIALDAPALNAFRSSVGLPKKDLHITLGYEEGDIHDVHFGTAETGKQLLRPIAKGPSDDFADIAVPDIQFGRLGGTRKQKKGA